MLALSFSALAQQTPNNDGFQRLNGQMQVVRNGRPRPLTRDAHLPNGATITTDGFVVSASGQRTELREGQACDFRGRPVAVRAAPDGTLVLAKSAASAAPAIPTRTVMEEMFGRSADDQYREGKYKKPKKAKKKHGKGHGRGNEEEYDD
ncbi:hypothetical protein GCM10027511_35150 [Hymenobacter humi]